MAFAPRQHQADPARPPERFFEADAVANTSLRTVMPTRRKPLLTHRSVEHAKITERCHKELCFNQELILKLVVLYEEFGDPDLPAYTGETEATQLLSELTGLLVSAATIRLDAGYKAPSKLLATVK